MIPTTPIHRRELRQVACLKWLKPSEAFSGRCHTIVITTGSL